MIKIDQTLLDCLLDNAKDRTDKKYINSMIIIVESENLILNEQGLTKHGYNPNSKIHKQALNSFKKYCINKLICGELPELTFQDFKNKLTEQKAREVLNNIDRKNVKKVSIAQCSEIFHSVGDLFLTVIFEKKNGDLRMITGRMNVQKHLKGGINTVAHIPKYIKIYDVNDNCYKNVNMEKVKLIRHKVDYLFI